jgi:hypothetical protein
MNIKSVKRSYSMDNAIYKSNKSLLSFYSDIIKPSSFTLEKNISIEKSFKFEMKKHKTKLISGKP